MANDTEVVEIKKATAYDLIQLLESNSEKRCYSIGDIKELFNAYIAGLTQG